MCASFLPRRAHEWQWRTVMDDWAIGRQEQDECVLCTLDGQDGVRDSTRHAVLGCPYAAAVLDAVARRIEIGGPQGLRDVAPELGTSPEAVREWWLAWQRVQRGPRRVRDN